LSAPPFFQFFGEVFFLLSGPAFFVLVFFPSFNCAWGDVGFFFFFVSHSDWPSIFGLSVIFPCRFVSPRSPSYSGCGGRHLSLCLRRTLFVGVLLACCPDRFFHRVVHLPVFGIFFLTPPSIKSVFSSRFVLFYFFFFPPPRYWWNLPCLSLLGISHGSLCTVHVPGLPEFRFPARVSLGPTVPGFLFFPKVCTGHRSFFFPFFLSSPCPFTMVFTPSGFPFLYPGGLTSLAFPFPIFPGEQQIGHLVFSTCSFPPPLLLPLSKIVQTLSFATSAHLYIILKSFLRFFPTFFPRCS